MLRSHQGLELTAVLATQEGLPFGGREPGPALEAEALDQMPALMAQGDAAIAPRADHHLPRSPHVEAIEIRLPAAGVIAHHRHAAALEAFEQLLALAGYRAVALLNHALVLRFSPRQDRALEPR